MISVRIQEGDFDPGAELARLEGLGGGALASFIGLVRSDGGLIDMELEHYPGMTLKAVEAIVAEAVHRWPLLGVGVIHRHGRLKVGDRIVFVGVTSPRRAAALEACAFLIDWLKTGAPFWKRERFADGRARWVEACASDDAAVARWVEA
ncbi:molybdenum cofactor biosynthesis protein MoaE [Flavisphingomonas formosensis]|uniref:molybdenum cofactor biosynthesis protein MoaE n=1 Tax=Flavisphingomonas formosensis TaxID=861534 RepID=UPI0012FA8846|nr:molybdenum cofactor biosynthesis protein MoaE [Sphingomonas formosensis]